MHSDARWQRRNAWLTIVALGAAVALAAAVRAGATARLDEEITRLLTLHQSAFANGMASVLAFVFSVDVSAVLMLVIAGFLWRRARWHAVALVAVFALTIVLELELKRWLQQPLGQIEQQFHAWVTHLRPGVNLNQLVLQPLWHHITRGRTGSPGVRPSDFGLRSGIMPAHAAAQGLRSGQLVDSFPSGHVLRAVLLAVVLTRLCPRRWLTAALALVVVMLAFARVYSGAHWASDVLGGALFGYGLGLAWGWRLCYYAAVCWLPRR